MKRQIIRIDEDKCNGCGQCATACAEGAIQMVDGKARLISEVFCDGLGACLGECPVGAIAIEQRDAEPYSEQKTLEKMLPQGVKTIQLHLEHLKNHCQTALYEEGIAFLKEKGVTLPDVPKAPFPMVSLPQVAMTPKEKPNTNWPIQLQLLNPDAGFFDNADVVIAADCTAFSLPDFYKRFTKNHALIVFCPKLDHATELYIDKLVAIFSRHEIRSLTLLRMVVPCCGGVAMIVEQALKKSGKEIDVIEYTVNFDGTMS